MLNGRPRNLEREVKILELMAAGKTATATAKACGVHRNTVYRTLERIGHTEDADYLTEINRLRLEIKQLDVQDKAIQDKRELAKREVRIVTLKNAARNVQRMIEQSREIMQQVSFSGEVADLQKLLSILNQEIENG